MLALIATFAIQALVSMTVLTPPVLAALAAPDIGVASERIGLFTALVYAGAILVTFLFVLMLAQPEGRAPYDRVSWEPPLSAAAGVVLVGVLSAAIGGLLSAAGAPSTAGLPASFSQESLATGVLAQRHVARFGAELFGRHLIAVEIAGVLLLVALVGAAVIVEQARPKPRG